MNNADLFRSVGEAGDELIEIKERRIGLWAYIGIAAAALLTAGAAALVILKPWKSDPRRTASLDPTDRPAITDKANITIAPAELPTPEPTPLLDLTGWKVVTGEGGGFEEIALYIEPGTVMIESKLQEALDNMDDEGALFKVEIVIRNNGAKLTEEELIGIQTRRESRLTEIAEYFGSCELESSFVDEFWNWFYNTYSPRYPKRLFALLIEAFAPRDPMQEMKNDAANIFYYTMLDRRFPDYYELFFNYLCENGEIEKVESYRPIAAMLRKRLYYDQCRTEPEYTDKLLSELKRLESMGYRIDVKSAFQRFSHSRAVAYLTKEQILDFPADPDYAYLICFCGWQSYED